MLPVVAAGSAAVNGKMAATSEGGRLRKSAYMAQRLFAPVLRILLRPRIRSASGVIREEPCTMFDVTAGVTLLLRRQ